MNKMLAYIIGKIVKTKLFKEGAMEGTKKWYASKNIWAGITAVLIGLYSLVQINLMPTLPVIPEWIFTLLGAIGIYTRTTATKTIAK